MRVLAPYSTDKRHLREKLNQVFLALSTCSVLAGCANEGRSCVVVSVDVKESCLAKLIDQSSKITCMLDGNPCTPEGPMLLDRQQREFSLNISSEHRGLLSIRIESESVDQIVTAYGQASIQLTGEPKLEMTVTLKISTNASNIWITQNATQVTSVGNLLGLWVADSKKAWAVGSQGRIFQWDGTSWTENQSATFRDLRGVWGSSSQDVWAVGEQGTIVHWDGTQWATAQTGTTSQLNAIKGSSAQDVWAVGAEGAVLHFDGVMWKVDTSAPFFNSENLTGLWVVDNAHIVIVSDSSLGLAVFKNGTQWIRPVDRASYALYDVWAPNQSTLWSVGAKSAIGTWSSGTWNPIPCPGQPTLGSMWGRKTNEIWAVGDNGTGVRLNAQGCTSIVTKTTQSLRAISGIGDDVWAVGDNGTIVHACLSD